MRQVCFILSAFLAISPLFAADGAPGRFAGYTVDNTEIRDLPVTEKGRHYRLYVGMPVSYTKDTSRRYPVVFVTDAYWDFIKMLGIGGALMADRVVPDFITVGIGYAGENLDYTALRNWELTPVPLDENRETSGHAADFLRTIDTVIIPFIEREYRVDSSYRVLAGGSLGGLFALYAMDTKPELFQSYIAATPAVTVGNNWIFDYEQAFAKSGKRLGVRLSMSAGGNEYVPHLAGILRMNARLASRHYKDFAYEFRIIDGERHAGMQAEAYSRGLRFAFAPRAPQSGPVPPEE